MASTPRRLNCLRHCQSFSRAITCSTLARMRLCRRQAWSRTMRPSEPRRIRVEWETPSKRGALKSTGPRPSYTRGDGHDIRRKVRNTPRRAHPHSHPRKHLHPGNRHHQWNGGPQPTSSGISSREQERYCCHPGNTFTQETTTTLTDQWWEN